MTSIPWMQARLCPACGDYHYTVLERGEGRVVLECKACLAPRPLRCPSCGVDRFTFDTKGGGFQRHIDEDHCMWRYLYCLCYLWDKVPTEYNGWEQHVAAKLAAGDFSFLPQNNAIVLRKLWMAKEEEHRALRDSIQHVRTQLDRLLVGESGKAMGQGDEGHGDQDDGGALKPSRGGDGRDEEASQGPRRAE